MEYMQMTLNEWINIKQKLRQELIGVKRSFVRIGYMLRKIDDHKGYEQDGYKSIAEFAQKELGLHPSTTTRFMEINREYSIDGYSERLREEYEDLSRSQLEEMLKLPEEDRAMIEPAASRESIRDLKRFNAQGIEPEESGYRISDTGQQPDRIRDLIEDFFRNNPKELNGIFELPEPADITEEYVNNVVEVVNPGGNRSYRKGVFFVMMYENKIMIKEFGNTPQELSWKEFIRKTWEIFGEMAAGAETWNKYFGQEEPEKAKVEMASDPEQLEEPETLEDTDQGETVDDRTDHTECGETKTPDEDTQGNIHSAGKRRNENKGERNTGDQSEERESDIEADNEIAPAQKTREILEIQNEEPIQEEDEPAMNPPEIVDRTITRKEYLETLTVYGMAQELEKVSQAMAILDASFWEIWLKTRVTEDGYEIEEEADDAREAI